MSYRISPDAKVQKLTIGREGAPLVVIDNVVSSPEALFALAVSKIYGTVQSHFPGIRAKVPLTYNDFVTTTLRALYDDYFGLAAHQLRITGCHFSLVTTPAHMLSHLQTIPHIDSHDTNYLAFVHYLFKRDLGGTAFYRHRRTGYEVIDYQRKDEYYLAVEVEKSAPNKPAPGYINGDTPFYEQVGRQAGVFNRMIIYRRTSLHSACLSPDFIPDPDPRTGRLTINGFIATPTPG